jgi:hypothetical protein
LGELAGVAEWIKCIDPRGNQSQLRAEDFPCLVIEGSQKVRLGGGQATVQGVEQLGPSHRRDHPASTSVSGVGSTLDQPSRYEVR